MRLGLWMRYLLGSRLAPFVPTPPHIASRMLQLAKVCNSDLVYDLGCGDGRLLLAAAKIHGAKGCGFELDSSLFQEASEAVRRENLAHMISIHRQDALHVDLSPATVVTLYLSENGNLKLLPKMKKELGASARVVSFCWSIAGLEPSRTAKVDGIPIFLYDSQALRSG